MPQNRCQRRACLRLGCEGKSYLQGGKSHDNHRHAQTREEADKQFTELVAEGQASSRAEGARRHPTRLEARSEPLLIQNDDFRRMIEPVAVRQSAAETLCWLTLWTPLNHERNDMLD